MKTSQIRIPLCDALRIKSAELWLRLGQPMQALMELQQLKTRAQKHPWTRRVFRAAYSTMSQ